MPEAKGNDEDKDYLNGDFITRRSSLLTESTTFPSFMSSVKATPSSSRVNSTSPLAQRMNSIGSKE